MITQLTLGVALRDDATFDNFYPGKNLSLIAYLKNNHDFLLYLWGVPSCGLTHILQALCWQSAHCLYLPLRAKQEFKPSILDNIENLDLLVIDDIDQVAGMLDWEEALFHAYHRLQQAGKKMIVGAHHSAKSLPFKLADWQSRLVGSTSIELNPLSDDEKRQALQLRAKQRGFELPEEVLDFLMRRTERSLSTLLNLLNQLDTMSLVKQRKITIPFVKEVLGM